MNVANSTAPGDFIRDIVRQDISKNKNGGRVQTRFPPEPNGYLHVGHARAIWINFGIAEEFGGKCNLRFDDTNPVKEEQEYIDAIIRDIHWLGYDWDDRLYYASSYFEQMYQYALQLIEAGKAYVDDLTAEQIHEYRGTLIEPGKLSPYRDRPVAENLDLFKRMRSGEFPDGSRVLRAKIDMASPNINMRDPVMYRILHATHPHTGDKWCIYPMYDWAHGLEDSIEGVTHSLCSLEFEDHRPLYDWFLDALGVFHPQQIEFARLNFTYTVMSKRFFRRMIEEGIVHGFDDPRLPTLSGVRRRGCPPEALINVCKMLGVAKTNSTADQVEEFEAINNPEDPAAGRRKVPFSRVLYIEQEDFREVPPPKYYRLAPGREIRLRYAYLVTCAGVKKDLKTGEVIEVHCTYDPATRGGDAPDHRKVKSTIHWVSAAHALEAEVRLYENLFTKEDPSDVEEGADFMSNVNRDSLEVLASCRIEPSLAGAAPGSRYQFERMGYFCVDPDTTPEKLVFNRTVSLRDDWAKIQKQQE
jgi:glutaminyl-tRNA synthetase